MYLLTTVESIHLVLEHRAISDTNIPSIHTLGVYKVRILRICEVRQCGATTQNSAAPTLLSIIGKQPRLQQIIIDLDVEYSDFVANEADAYSAGQYEASAEGLLQRASGSFIDSTVTSVVGHVDGALCVLRK